MKSVLKDKVFIKTMLVLAFPIMLQNFITSSLNLIDNVMIGTLGESAIAAVGLANQYIFVFLLCIIGINAGASIFMAQYWGKKDIQSVKKVLGVDLTVGFIATLIFASISFFFPEIIMKILSKDSEVISLGAGYLRIVSISCIVTNVSQCYSSALRSTEQVKVPMYASLMGVLTNAFLNWIFIFGNLGVEAMGVNGAALATTIARVVEMLVVLGAVYGRKNIVASKIKELFNFDFEFIKTYFKTSSSVIANELLWSLGMTAYSIAYAQIGTNAVATMQIATTLINMFMVICIGLASAAAIMVGNKIGAKEEEIAIDYSHKLGAVSPIVGILLGVLIWVLAPIIIAPFNVSGETFDNTIKVLRVMAIFCPLRFYNVVMIVGIFRGGGDTLYSMLVQLGTVWLFAVPIAFVSAVVFKMPIYMVYFMICLEEIIKIVFERNRLKSGKWIRRIV